jgi:hypothetical protein
VNAQFKKGDPVRILGKPDYGNYEFLEYLPKGAEGKKCRMVEVAHFAPGATNFGLRKQIRLVDVRKK